MKFNNKVSEATMQKVKELLEKAEDKSEAIMQSIEMIAEERNQNLIKEVVAEANNANSKAASNSKLGLRTLSEEENKFYDSLKTDPKQAVTGSQIDLIPNTIIDNTLADLKAESDLLSLVTFAPADVKKWLVASKTGQYHWGNLTAGIEGELSATFTSLNIELGKLTAYLVLPKAIRDLANPFVDKYFTAILKETMHDGLEYAFLYGTGKDEPIGVFKKVSEVEGDSTHKKQTKHATLKSFSPKAMAPVKQQLSHNGVRDIPGLVLVCNPMDQFAYVDPALFVQTAVGTYVATSKDKIRVIPTANCQQGDAGLLIDSPKYYTMGLSAVQLNEYKETKALDDADVVIAKCYGNGRPQDDDVCYYFDPSKLEEFKPTVRTETATAEAA